MISTEEFLASSNCDVPLILSLNLNREDSTIPVAFILGDIEIHPTST